MSVHVGQQLRQARQAKNLSLQHIARVTYIRAAYLEALEAGQLDRLPSMAQARGFLRTYANYLGLPTDTLLAHLKGNTAPRPEEIPVPAEPPSFDGSREYLFAEIGQALRQHREMLGLKLEDIERQIRVRKHYLEALEAGQLDLLPSPVQGRGMLNNYAAFLGLDPEPLLLKFADGLQSRLSARRGPRAGRPDPRAVDPIPRGGGVRRFLSTDLLFSVALGTALMLFVVWAAIRISSLQTAEQPEVTAPAIVDILAPEVTVTPTARSDVPLADFTLEPDTSSGGSTDFNPETGLEVTPTLDVPIPVLSEDAIQLYIISRQRAWMRITVDGEIQFDGRVIPGNAYSFSGQETVELLTSSGSALQVVYNQADIGPLGSFGQVVQLTFTKDSILTPTATITPTPTITNTPEATLTPEPTGTIPP